MHRLIIIFIGVLFTFQTLNAQVALEKTTFDLGQISLLNEDIIDLNLSNNTDKKLFIIRIASEDHVRVKFTSRTIEPGESELLRVKLNPSEEGKYKTSMQLFFGQNMEAIDLEFTAEVLEIPVNQLQACPDFSANRTSSISPGSYKKQEKGEIHMEQVAVVRESELEDYLLAKKVEREAALAYEKEKITEMEVAEIVEEEEIEYNYQSEIEPEVERVMETEEKEEKEEQIGIAETEEEVDPSLLSNSYKPNNIVFLLDASTSMNKDGKMDLLKSSMKELLIPLRSIDKIAIVSYAGEASLLLASTEASNKQKISSIIESIPADGSTNAVKGLRMALQVAKSNFIEGGNNQIILATDGAFDIGSKNTRLRNRIEKSSNEDIIISVIGIKNDRWTNKSLKEIADLGGGDLLRIHSDRNLSVILEEVKGKSLR